MIIIAKKYFQRGANIALLLASTLSSSHGLTASTQENPLSPPPPARVTEAKGLIAHMKASTRGPYERIMWFCADGSTQAPKAFACKDHGGGKQHALYSKERMRLAELGLPVGTIFSALSATAFFDGDNRNQYLRTLPLERYLMDIDDGWVLRRAKDYRGRVQIEDEEIAGRELLLSLLNKPSWLAQNYLLVRELVKVVPHGAATDLSRQVRRSAQELAERESSFERLRVEVHTTPTANTATKIRAWNKIYAANAGADSTNVALAEQLIIQLDTLYGSDGRKARLGQLYGLINQRKALKALAPLTTFSGRETSLQTLARLADLSAAIREQATGPLAAEQKLALLDGLSDVETELRLQALDQLANSSLSRRELLTLAEKLVAATYGVGLLSPGEWESIKSTLSQTRRQEKISPQGYLALTEKLNASGAWAVASVRYHFAEALIRYTAVEPRAATFVDDLLRSSIILQLAEVARRLGSDAQLAAGIKKRLFGRNAPAAMALNPGLARGKLRIMSEEDIRNHVQPSKNDIVVLTQTVSELSPVAGVITTGEGNVLSHVQMLARNFGIPNVSITPSIAGTLAAHQNADVVLSSTRDGSVVLMLASDLNETQEKLLATKAAQTRSQKLRVPPVDTQLTQPLILDDVDKTHSGRLVGPKAANLGELNHLFPGRVAPAIALPFGSFLAQVNRQASTEWAQLSTLYEQRKRGEISAEKLDSALEQLRQAVFALQIDSTLRQQLEALMAQHFGPANTYGIFIRSDTNAEDLPGFSGAGLYDTIANVVGLEKQLATIPKVWASILNPRAIAWRANLLENPDNVFPSVLLMKSVAAEKSGVLVTWDLINRQAGLTVSTAWGVGGAVAGEAAETLILLPEGKTELVSQAKSPWQRQLPLSDGVFWAPAADGFVLTDDEQQQLRKLALEVAEKYLPHIDENGQPQPWDIEFGFVDGKLTLFQIRPLVEPQAGKADQFIQQVFRNTAEKDDAPTSHTIDLTKLPFKSDI